MGSCHMLLGWLERRKNFMFGSFVQYRSTKEGLTSYVTKWGIPFFVGGQNKKKKIIRLAT